MSYMKAFAVWREETRHVPINSPILHQEVEDYWHERQSAEHDAELAAFDDSFSDLGYCVTTGCESRTADRETALCWYCDNPWAKS